jgi:hypothetical protein
MQRGGRRDGAGRPPNVSQEDAEFIRRDYEQRARAAQREQWEATNMRKIAKREGVTWGEPNPVELVPRDDRKDVSDYGLKWPDKPIPEKFTDVVYSAIMLVRENKKKKTRRHQSTETLPKLAGGQRQKIIAAVAQAWGVPPRTVRTIIEAKPGV